MYLLMFTFVSTDALSVKMAANTPHAPTQHLPMGKPPVTPFNHSTPAYLYVLVVLHSAHITYIIWDLVVIRGLSAN